MLFAAIVNVFGLPNLANRLVGLALPSGAGHSGTLPLSMYCPNSKVAVLEASSFGAAWEISMDLTGRCRF
jgi:hypothetical protein